MLDPTDGSDGAVEPAVCPECLAPGELVDRFVLDSTDGPVEHLHVRCVVGHRFVLPAEGHARAVEAALRPAAPRGAPAQGTSSVAGGDQRP